MKVVAKSVAAMALAALVAAPAARAAEATVGADLSSAYVFRGVTFNDGAVIQPYLDVSGLPIDIGVWGNIDIDDMDGALESGQFSEIDVYASYGFDVEGIDLSAGYCEYTYPLGGIEADRELSFSVGLDLPLAPAIGFYYGLDGGIEKSFYIDFGVGHEIEVAEGVTLGLGALAAYLDPDEGESGFHQYELSAGLGYEMFSLGVTYYGQIDDDVLPDGAYDVEVVATLGVSHSF